MALPFPPTVQQRPPGRQYRLDNALQASRRPIMHRAGFQEVSSMSRTGLRFCFRGLSFMLFSILCAFRFQRQRHCVRFSYASMFKILYYIVYYGYFRILCTLLYTRYYSICYTLSYTLYDVRYWYNAIYVIHGRSP